MYEVSVNVPRDAAEVTPITPWPTLFSFQKQMITHDW